MEHILCKIAVGCFTVNYCLWLLWYCASKPFKKPIVMTEEEKAILLGKLKELLAVAESNKDEWCKHK